MKAREILRELKVKIEAEEFEKDEDDNGHIDFIYALANCRSQNYVLEPMDWITVQKNIKLKKFKKKKVIINSLNYRII